MEKTIRNLRPMSSWLLSFTFFCFSLDWPPFPKLESKMLTHTHTPYNFITILWRSNKTKKKKVLKREMPNFLLTCQNNTHSKSFSRLPVYFIIFSDTQNQFSFLRINLQNIFCIYTIPHSKDLRQKKSTYM